MTRVLIADDHPVVRAGLRGLLSAEPDITVAAEAATAEDAVALAGALQVDLVLMDLQFGKVGLQGAAATRQLRSLDPAPEVLILTNYDSDADILGAVEAGACGYLLKDAPPEELLSAIRVAAAGESSIGPALKQRRDARDATLSARELELLTLVADGKTNREICAALFLSDGTVKAHLNHIFTKLSVGTRTAAVARARELGLLRR